MIYINQLSEDDKAIVNAAVAAASAAYCPYSQFPVGAAVRGSVGVFAGANIENASWGLTMCAERTALSAAVLAGERQIVSIAVACVKGDLTGGIHEFMPCGACRQWISELAPHARVLIVMGEQVHMFSSEELLPCAFRLRKMRQ